MWKTGDPETAADGGFIPGMVKKAESPWMNNFLILEVGRTLELGFEKTEGILKFLCQYLNGMLTDPGYNPYLVQEYRIPTVKDNSAVPGMLNIEFATKKMQVQFDPMYLLI